MRRATWTTQGIAALPVTLLVGGLVSGCTTDFATEGDALRRRVLNLETENDRLRGRVAELEAAVARAAAAPGQWTEEVASAAPHVAGIVVHRLSHVEDVDADGRPDLLRLYVEPRDGRGRFVQLAGDLAVRAEVVTDDAAGHLIASVSLRPRALRDAYRSGLFGTHYTVECPLAWPDGIEPQDLFVRVVYVDGRTARRFTDDAVVGSGPRGPNPAP